MKPKLLETKIRRYQMVAAFNRENRVNCPVCLVSTGTPYAAGPPPWRMTEIDRKPLLLVSNDTGLGVRLGHTANLAGLAFLQINDAVNALRLAARERPAVVMVDLDLPALAGWETAEKFLEDEHCPPIVLVTSRTEDHGLGAAIHAGTVVDKSASPARMREKVDALLAEPDAMNTNRRASQKLLIRWLRPYCWATPVTLVNRHWGINE